MDANKYNFSGLIKMNLQLLADENTAETTAEESNTAEAQGEENKTYTEDELKARIQSESDKRVTEALKTAKEKWEKDYKKQLEEKTTEAKKLAEMDAQQKAEYERDQLKKELEELKNAQSKAEMTKTARKMLSEHDINISEDLLGMLVTKEADTTKANIESFTELFNSAVEKAIKERVKGTTPKKKGTNTITKEDILKIKNRQERQKLIAENLELFE